MPRDYNGTRAFKGTLTRHDARNGREEVTIRLRKRRNDDRLKQIRFRTITVLPREKAMTGEEALLALLKFLQNNPDGRNYLFDMDQAVIAINTMKDTLLKDSSNEMVDKFVQAGTVNLFFSLLELPRHDKHLSVLGKVETLQVGAATCLADLASAENGMKPIADSENGLDICGRTINESTFEGVRLEMLQCLGNLGGHNKDGGACRKKIRCHKETFQAVLTSLQKPLSAKTLLKSIWSVSNLVTGVPAPALDEVRDILLTFMNMLNTALADKNLEMGEVDEIIASLFGALRKATINNPQALAFVVLADSFIAQAFTAVRRARQNKNVTVSTRIMNFLRLATGGAEELRNALIGNRFFIEANLLLEQDNDRLSACVCEGLADLIALGSPEQVQGFCHTRHMLLNLICIAEKGKWEAKRAALSVLFHFLIKAKDNELKVFIQKKGGIQILCGSLQFTKDYDVGLCFHSLLAIENILRVDRDNGGTWHMYRCLRKYKAEDYLEDLQNQVDQGVFNKAANILQEYFCENDENMEPDSDTTETDNGGMDSGAAASLVDPASN